MTKVDRKSPEITGNPQKGPQFTQNDRKWSPAGQPNPLKNTVSTVCFGRSGAKRARNCPTSPDSMQNHGMSPEITESSRKSPEITGNHLNLQEMTENHKKLLRMTGIYPKRSPAGQPNPLKNTVSTVFWAVWGER